ncbi:hypothetical protein [Pseudoxanthomonas putridarboris]|uniref:Hydrazine synthase alpha subunit middle domain-containing protein n=1 Tax=Pseudoxanthomonas putridarboris TaxID=752605 RepID=A0ABU9J1U5_9GAMM
MHIAPGALSRRILPTLALGLTALLASCSGEQNIPAATTDAEAQAVPTGDAPSRVTASAVAAAAPVVTTAVQTPILFVTQIPTAGGDRFASRLSSFANHLTDLGSVPRGGDLMIRYPNGALRNLTKEAGFGMEGLQGSNAIAVREPTVHWDGKKAVFSMLVGAPAQQYASVNAKWQIYEVTNLTQGQTAVITKVAGQPANYNNVSPLYTSDDRILFTSDRPRGGESHLYPQLDEYESTPTITGIYSLTPSTGELRLLNHTPSGAFSPTIDSYGRVIFTRWDHLQRDQQADAGSYGDFNYASEAAGAANIGRQAEIFPESRNGMDSSYGRVNPFTYNLFTPWQMNQDGTEELTLNHIGRHELSFGYLTRSFSTDSALSDYTNTAIIANKKNIRMDGGVFQVREDPRTRGTYYGIYAREFGSLTSDQIVRFTGAPTLNAEQMVFEDASPAGNGNSLSGGRFRNPLPMSTGQMVATYTPSATVQSGVQFRLYQLKTDAAGMLIAGSPLTSGISKSISWWSPDSRVTFNGTLWELEAVEVVARPRPGNNSFKLEAPESAVLAEEQVSETALRNWMKANNLSLIVTRNQTSRDQADVQQPFNLQVPGGVKTSKGSGKVYNIAHYQILQGNQIRAYSNFKSGRRVIAQPTTSQYNPANSGGPAGSVKIAADGSTAAFVPANRALTWQTTDAAGTPVVRERVWVTTQPGEIRTCAGCHGENSRNQAGAAEATNKPEALRQLLRHWKQTSGGGSSAPILVNGSQPLTPTRGTTSSSQPAPAASQPSPSSSLTTAVIDATQAAPKARRVLEEMPRPTAPGTQVR